jgi:hypothetical protein
MDGRSPLQDEIDRYAAVACAATDHPDLDFPNVYFWATGWDAVPALIAASITQRLMGLIVENAPAGLAEQLYYSEAPMDTYQARFVFPATFPAYDVPDLIAPYAPGFLYLADGGASSSPEIAAAFAENRRWLERLYADLGESGRLTVGPADFDAIVARLNTWH